MGSAGLIGRRTQLATMREALVSAAEGRSHCVLVTGEAGIGKTRLVTEALAGADARIVTGHCVNMSTGEIPFGVLADTLRDLTRRKGNDVLTSAEREALGPLLPGRAPSADVDRVQLLSTFIDLLERLATERLLVWVVEDLQWADSATRDVVNLAARTIRGQFLLVATIRTEDPDRSEKDDAALISYLAALARTPGCTVLPVGRLSSEEVHAQLAVLLGTDAPPGVVARIERLSDGVPFLVEELASNVERPQVATASAVAAGRLAGLSAEARRMVDAVAVGDGHLRISLVEQVLDALPEELDTALVEAVRAGILVTDASDDFLGFRHALLRDATDRAMAPGARRSWHRRWAEVLEANPGVLAFDPAAVAVAEHWHHARDVRRAVSAAMAALPAAERIGDPGLESRLWRRALRGWGQLDDAAATIGVSLRDAVAHAVLTAKSARQEDVRAVLDAVPTHLMAEAERGVLAVWRVLMDEPKAEVDPRHRDVVRDLFDSFDLFDDDRDLFALCVLGLTTHLPPGDERATRAIRQAADIADELGTVRARIESVFLGSMSHVFIHDPRGAADYLEARMVELRGVAGESALWLEGNLMWCRAAYGQHREAQRLGERALDRLRHPELSIALWEHLVENYVFSLLCTGDWPRARKLLEKSTPWWEDDLRSSNVYADMLDLAQRGSADVGRWRAVLGQRIPDGAPSVGIHHLLALAAASSGDIGGARAHYRTIWSERSRMLDDDDYVWCVLRDAARAEADVEGDVGDRGDAAQHLAHVLEIADQTPKHGPLGEAWSWDLAAQLDRFHGRDARPALTEALAAWERVDHRPDVAITHLSLAEQHAVRGDRDAARFHLLAARGIAEALEALPLLARARQLSERYALNVRERRVDDLLTGRETEVLRLLAEGRTNAEIAGTLFMATKTASVHVSRIITKLGATNRTEAAAIARRQGLVAD